MTRLRKTISANPCDGLRAHRKAHKQCKAHLRKLPQKQRGAFIRNIDIGVPRTEIPNMTKRVPSYPLVAGTKGDGSVQLGEWLQWRLNKGIGAAWSLKTNSTTQRIQRSINFIRMFASVQHARGSRAYNLKVAKDILEWSMLPAPRGLGLIPFATSEDNIFQTRSLRQVLKDSTKRSANTTNIDGEICLELAFAYYNLFKLAKLKPVFLMVTKTYKGVETMVHYCIGIRPDPLRPNHIVTIDPIAPKKLWIGTPHKVTPISEKAMQGLYHMGKAISLYRNNKIRIAPKLKSRIKSLLIKAHLHAPHHPLVLFNLANYFILIDPDKEKAIACLKRAIALHPNYESAKKLLRTLTSD